MIKGLFEFTGKSFLLHLTTMQSLVAISIVLVEMFLDESYDFMGGNVLRLSHHAVKLVGHRHLVFND